MFQTPPYRVWTQHLVFIALVTLLGGLLPTRAHAQNTYQQATDPWTVARKAYRQHAWEKARHYTAAASQRDPDEPRYYLSLARIYFQEGQYNNAVWYYDLFITLAQKQGANYQGIYALSRAQSERRSANARRDDPKSQPDEPEAQMRVRHALRTRLEQGPVIDTDGGGALATFKTLLRLGYANPDLPELRNALDQAAAKEAQRLLREGHGYLPTLTYQQWQQQAHRFDATNQLIPAPIPFDAKTRRAPTAAPHALPTRVSFEAYRYLAQGQAQYLYQNWANAAAAFQQAVERKPTLVLAYQGLINALIHQDKPNLGAIKQAIDGYRTYCPNDPALTIYVPLAYAAIGDADKAAADLMKLLTTP